MPTLYERNPSIPAPPPPPRPQQLQLGTPRPTISQPEKIKSGELTPVETALFKNSAEYGNLTPEQAQMTPKLREILNNFRKDRLFAVDVYTLSGGGDGAGGRAAYDKKVIKEDPGIIINDISGGRDEGIEQKRSQGIAEALAFTPQETKDRKIVEKVTQEKGWFQKEIKQPAVEYSAPRPLKFQEILMNPTTANQEQAVRITYHVSDPKDPKRYAVDTRMDVSWRRSKDEMDSRGTRYYPKPFSNDPAENINGRMQDILTTRNQKVDSSARANNRIAISVTLPKSRAEELWKHFQQNPEQVRPFFIAGGEDLMTLHLRPPYKTWDQENPNKPILFREFNGQKQEVAKAIIPSNKK